LGAREKMRSRNAEGKKRLKSSTSGGGKSGVKGREKNKG